MRVDLADHVATRDADVLEELEYALITADIGSKTTSEILERIRQRVERHLVGDTSQLKGLIKEQLMEILDATERSRANNWERSSFAGMATP